MKSPINRRWFLQKAGSAAAAVAVAGPGLLIRGGAKTKEYELVICGGLLYDGTGSPPISADIGIGGGVVKAIGKISASRGIAGIDARGRAVAPGFIDVHVHTDLGLLANPKAESAVRQGVTTIISGNCGYSPYPIADEVFEETRADAKTQLGVDVDWRDLKGFLARLENRGTAINYGTLVGHGAVRGAAMGFADRPPAAAELEAMKKTVADNIRAGALGLSTGLEYTPGSFAGLDEVTALCRVVAAAGGVYATHMRDEGDALIESLREAVAAARASGVKLQISHLKTAYPRNWGKIGAALAEIENARRGGVDISCDRYPYLAGSTGLDFNFPAWAREGTTKEFLARLKNPDLDARLREAIAEREKVIGSWDKAVIASVVTEKNKWTEGLSVLAAARRSGRPVFEFMRDLLIDERDAVDMVIFMMCEENLVRILAHPLVGVGSDSSTLAPYGVLGAGKPHPRAYGTFPRVLGTYVREKKIVPAETMIMKMTSRPAAKFGLTGRGLVKAGASADLVVYDPDKIADRATWADPHRYPAGVEHVIVNGVPVVADGEHTGRLPGRVLRKTGSR